MQLRWKALGSRWLSRVALAGLVCLAGTTAAPAQIEKKAEPNEQQPLDKAKLEARYNKDLKKVIQDLIKGTASAKENPEAVDVLAQWHTYRVTWPEIQSTPGLISGDGAYSVMGELELFLQETGKNKAATAPLLEMFSTKVAQYMPTVLHNDKPIARINGARILARLADVGREEVADVLCGTVADPKQYDGVKYYALKGLRALLAQANQAEPTVFQSKAGKDREVRCLAVVGQIINRKVEITDDLPRDEVEGLRAITREAVRALATSRRAAVTDDKGKIVDMPAMTLLRVARSDGIVPEPRIETRLEAAVGVARMSTKSFEGYHADYAAYQLGWFVTDLAQARRDPRETNKQQPWKIHAARLADALVAMKGDASKQKEAVYIGKLIDEAQRNLKKMETTDTSDPQPITFLLNNPPPNGTLYKDVPDAAIKDTGIPSAKPAEKTEKEKGEQEKK